jgi:hypothetical protein
MVVRKWMAEELEAVFREQPTDDHGEEELSHEHKSKI